MDPDFELLDELASAEASAANSASDSLESGSSQIEHNATTRAPGLGVRRNHSGPRSNYFEPDDNSSDAAYGHSEAANGASDVEEARRYVEAEQRASFVELLDKWDRDDDGDIVDLRTGRIINNVGHLQALPMARVYADSMSSEESQESSSSSTKSITGETAAMADPLTELVHKPTPLLNEIVNSLSSL